MANGTWPIGQQRGTTRPAQIDQLCQQRRQAHSAQPRKDVQAHQAGLRLQWRACESLLQGVDNCNEGTAPTIVTGLKESLTQADLEHIEESIVAVGAANRNSQGLWL